MNPGSAPAQPEQSESGVFDSLVEQYDIFMAPKPSPAEGEAVYSAKKRGESEEDREIQKDAEDDSAAFIEEQNEDGVLDFWADDVPAEYRPGIAAHLKTARPEIYEFLKRHGRVSE